ncbi:MAG: hypothetical protein WC657_08535 [Candidatus Paceibacterota bacterium]|jgi:hypothetical protein
MSNVAVETPTYEVKGLKASSYEFFFAMALEKFGIEYLFQVWYWGGRTVRGGQVLDFLIFRPFERPVQIYGEFWHKGQMASEDKLKLALLEQFFQQEVLTLWGPDVGTYEDALKTVRNKIL